MIAKNFFLAAAACIACAPAAHAFQLNGGDVDLSYSFFTEETDVSRLGIEGSAELGFSRNIAMQLDVSGYNFNESDETGTSIAAHGIYHLSNGGSFGAYIGRDTVDDEDIDFYGIEFATQQQQFDIQAHIGQLDSGNEDALAFGVSGSYAFNEVFGVFASIDRIDFDGDFAITRFGVGPEYSFSPNVSAFAELGTLGVSVGGDSDSETFVGIGLTVKFGGNGTATFDRRGYLKLFPGA